MARLAPWAVFVMVSLELLKAAPEINPNDIGVLTMILMVVLYLLPRARVPASPGIHSDSSAGVLDGQ